MATIRTRTVAGHADLGHARDMRRQWQVTGVGLAGAAVVAAAVMTGSGPGRGPAEARSGRSTAEAPATTAPALPAVIRSCWVPTASENISLGVEEAKALTTLAARAGDPDRRKAAVRAAVDRAVDVTPGQAAVVTRSLLGQRSTQRLTCSHVRLGVEPERAGPSGLTPRARRLRAAWTEVFGPLIAGGFASGGVSTGHVDSSSHYDGRAIDVFFRPLGDAEQRRRGRVFAQWLVAHAQDFHVLSVIYADQIWTSWAAYAGWREYVHPSGNRTNAILRHLDHVHVAVESGRPYRPR